MGGAPANFSCHAKGLGAHAEVISRVGTDEAGTGLIANLIALGLDTDGITRDPVNPTGSVEVKLGDDGQPEFKITSCVAWDHLQTTPESLRSAETADGIYFGSLGQRSSTSCATICSLVSATPTSALRVFDVNLREDYFTSEILNDSLALANVCKLSDAELPVIAAMLGLSGSTCDQLEELLNTYELRLVVYTRGANGSLLYNGREWSEHPGFPTVVRDTIGAGDSFTAAVTMGLLQGWPLEKISRHANETAAYVCAHDGAVPELPRSLRDRFQWSGWENSFKVTASNSLEWVAD